MSKKAPFPFRVVSNEEICKMDKETRKQYKKLLKQYKNGTKKI